MQCPMVSAKSGRLLTSQKAGMRPVGVVPDIQAGEFVQLDVIVNLGIRVTTEDLDVMAKVGERTSDVPGVDTLAAAMFLASVGEQCDP